MEHKALAGSILFINTAMIYFSTSGSTEKPRPGTNGEGSSSYKIGTKGGVSAERR